MAQVGHDLLEAKMEESLRLLERARRVAPGGIQGDGRWTEPFPIFMARADGARVWDVDGNEYIDYWASAGPSVLGHNDGRVRRAVIETLESEGVLFTTPHRKEVELAEKFSEIVPCADKTSFCGGGASDAMYNAVRVARAYTGKTKLLKFEGGYHGWHDDVAVSVRPTVERAGPADSPHAVPVSAGSLAAVTGQVVVAPLNDQHALERILDREQGELAAVIIEPVCHSLGCVEVDHDLLRFLRSRCSDLGIVLIFDEVITGFRHDIGGAQALCGITPDLGVFGKAMANGYTISALAGTNAIMSEFMPEGSVFLSGTYMGNLIGVTASLATIDILQEGSVHKRLWALGERVSTAVNETIEDLGLDAKCHSFGGFWSLYFKADVKNYRDVVRAADRGLDEEFRRFLLDRGIYLQGGHANSARPSRAFISAAHTDEDIDVTIEAVTDFLANNRERLQ